MAQKISVILIDDVDGKPADETVVFGIDGTQYEIDLSVANANALRADLAKWVENARKVPARGRGRRSAVAPAGRGDSALVRKWAAANGYEVSPRGRISAEVRAAYDAANK